MKVTDTHVFFWKGSFSQWKHSPVIFRCKQFNCAEQFMMYYKAICFKDEKTAEAILASNDPREQKAFGRDVKNYIDSDWNKVRQDIVWIGNYLKFTQHESLRNELLDTGNRLLVEASPYDRIWGIGYSEDEAEAHMDDWGQNLLGKTITSVRDCLISRKEPDVLSPEVFFEKEVWK